MSQTMSANANEPAARRILPTLDEVMDTLDELTAAARSGDEDRCRAALLVAESRGIDSDWWLDDEQAVLDDEQSVSGCVRAGFDHREADRSYDWSEGSLELAGVCWCGDHSCLGDPCVNRQ